MKIKAANNHIIVDSHENVERKTDGGIVIPETASLPQAYGTIISVGPDVKDSAFKPGIKIVFAKFGGQVILQDKKILKVLKEEEVYGFVEEE